MAVLIRGENIPKGCGVCFAFNWELECCQLYSHADSGRCDIEDTKTRPDWCELEEVKDED